MNGFVNWSKAEIKCAMKAEEYEVVVICIGL